MSTRARPNSERRAGFTLVEVLLTLLIMGGIMLAMTTILTAARTSRDTIHNIQEAQLAGPAIMDLIERDLRGIATYDRPIAGQLRVKNRVMLGIDGDSLDFVTTNDSVVLQDVENRFVRADANEVGYRLRKAQDSDQFLEIYRREGFGVDGDPFEGGNFVFLHDRVKGFDIQCYAKDGADQDPADEWDSGTASDGTGLPARIEITLTLELAPRLVNEQLLVASIERRTVVYRRVIRLPESLRVKEEAIAMPMVPQKPKPPTSALPGAAPGAAGNSDAGSGLTGNGGPEGTGKPPPFADPNNRPQGPGQSPPQ